MLRRSLVTLLGLAVVSPGCEMDTTGNGDDTDTDSEDTEEDDSDSTDADDEGEESDDHGSDESDSDESSESDEGSGDSGTDDTGSDDTGSDDTGSDDTGSDDTGSDDTGSDDTGTDDTGTDDTGSDDTGDDDVECVEDDECGANTPYCENGTCVGCDGLTSSTCEDKNPETPACRDSGGPCVECTTEQDQVCEADGLVCGDDYTCRPCAEHSECDVACNLDDGVCVDATAFHVDNVNCVGGKETGTEEDPFCTIGEGVSAITGVGPGVVVVHAGNPYVERVGINGSKVVVLLGEGSPELRASNEEVLSIDTGGKLFGSGLLVGEAMSARGVDCNGGSVWLDDSEVSGNSTDGINVQDCDVHLRRTSISGSGANGVNVNGGTLSLSDVTISQSQTSGVRVDGATVDLTDVAISSSDVSGVHVASEATLTMVGGTISDSGTSGVHVVSGGTLDFSNVHVSDSTENGINMVNGGTLTLTGGGISDNGTNGVHLVNGGGLTLAGTVLSGNTLRGLLAVNAEVHASRAQILANDGGGIHLQNESLLTMDNSIIGGNGGNGTGDTVGLSADGSSFDLVYVTIANNLGSEPHHSMLCENLGTWTIRNSIIVSQDTNSVACAGVVVTQSAVQDPDIVLDNADVGMWGGTWFVDPSGNDYHLGSAKDDFADVARWLTNDPAADIDGDPRPTTNDTPDWPGADVPG